MNTECFEDIAVHQVLINGIGGQMGAALMKAIGDSDCGLEIACGVDPLCQKSLPFPVFASADAVDVPTDVVIDFSVPSATEQILAFCLKKRIPAVICTTALSDALIQKIDDASKEIPIFRSGNMSIGVNLMRVLLKQTRQTLGDTFDIEIVETHHNRKKDAPSGTALMLADAIREADGVTHTYVYGRSEKDRRREKGEIGFHSIRGGTIVGQHEVRFLGQDEEISIRHEAYSKQVFAQGAMRAAEFLLTKKNGLYTMEDLVSDLLK